MPCDQVIEITVDFAAADPSLVKLVLAELRLDGIVGFSGGKLIGSERLLSKERVATIKRAYAEKTVQRAAQKFGWKQSKVGKKLVLKR